MTLGVSLTLGASLTLKVSLTLRVSGVMSELPEIIDGRTDHVVMSSLKLLMVEQTLSSLKLMMVVQTISSLSDFIDGHTDHMINPL